jgi:DNA primase
MAGMNWRAVDWVARVLMGVLLVVGFVFFVQETGGRGATLCFVIVIVLSFLSRYAGTRSNR